MGRDMYHIDRKDNFRQWRFFSAEVGAVLHPQLSICLLELTRIDLLSFGKE